jgi:hypothetical protein
VYERLKQCLEASGILDLISLRVNENSSLPYEVQTAVTQGKYRYENFLET